MGSSLVAKMFMGSENDRCEARRGQGLAVEAAGELGAVSPATPDQVGQRRHGTDRIALEEDQSRTALTGMIRDLAVATIIGNHGSTAGKVRIDELTDLGLGLHGILLMHYQLYSLRRQYVNSGELISSAIFDRLIPWERHLNKKKLLVNAVWPG